MFWALEIENTVNKMNQVLFFTDGAYILKGDVENTEGTYTVRHSKWLERAW